MSGQIKTVRPGRSSLIHIETPLGVVNIFLGLTDEKGRRLERIEIVPSGYADRPQVMVKGSTKIKLVEQTADDK